MIHRLRVPRWALEIDALQPLLMGLHRLRKQFYPRPGERAAAAAGESSAADLLPGELRRRIDTGETLLAAGRLDEAQAEARQTLAAFPDSLEGWLQLGRIRFSIEERRSAAEAAAAGGHGAPAKSSQSLLEEDGELLDLLARPAAGPSPGRSVEELRARAAALAAENESLALRLEPLRQQVGHRVDALETWIKYEHTKYYMRAMALYMRRYGVIETLPAAPAEMTAEQREGFAMDGAAALQAGYLNAANPPQYQDIYTDFDLETFQRVWRGEPAASDDDRQCQIDFALLHGPTDQAMQRFVGDHVAPGGRVAVVGSRGPVYEALCLSLGAQPTTIRRTPVVNRAKALSATTFADWEKSPSVFDAAIAVGVVEQAGLGMHGEAVDPQGDMKLMAMMRRMVKPGGHLFLVLPTGPDAAIFNAARVYGTARLPRLLEGWTVKDRHRQQEALLHGRGEDRSLFVLVNAA